MQEIEAEMIAKTQRLRAQAAQAQAQAQAQAEAEALRARAQAEAEARARAQAQAHAQMLAQQQQQQQQQQMRPPRMHSQSPSTFVRLQPQTQAGRVHSPSLAYQQNLLEQQDQMRLEELERQLREQMYLEQEQLLAAGGERALVAQLQQQQRRQALTEQRQLQEFTNDLHRFSDQPSDIQALLQLQKRQQSPMRRGTPQQQLQQQYAAALNGGRGQNMPSNLHDVQLQQRLLAQLAQEEFSQVNVRNQEVLRAEAMRKIMETERLEGKRRRKAAKLAHMVSTLLYWDRLNN